MSDTPISRSSRSARRDPRLTALAEDSGYEIQGRIGSGGMGIVYRAQDADGRDVAIKLLRHEVSDDRLARERLAREVAAQKLVRNDNIVRILDAELDSSDAFVVTEFVPGPTLDDAVRAQGGLHPEAVREIGLAMGDALHAIHRAGVIHRDLKPSNVLLRNASEEDLTGFDPDGDRLDPVIIDFGIAIAAEESRMTSTGLVMGTAAYLDPEVIRTDHTGEAGDWWGWAALLAFAATGRDPYGSGRADLVFLRAERGEIDIDGVPVELGDWLRSALQSKPTERPAPEDLLARLAELDLTRYEDAGPTEALRADGRTAALPAGAAAAGAAGVAAASSDRESGADSSRPDADAEPATEALPPVTTPTEQPTQALPRMETPSEPATEALPRHQSAEDAPTEALPVTGPPTQQMPVIPPSAPSQEAGFPTGTQHPVQRGPQQHLASPPRRQDPYQQVPQPHPVQQAPAQQAPVQQAPGQQAVQPGQDPSWPPPPGAGQMAPQGAWATPMPPPRRPLLVWIGHLLIVALAAVAPYVALTVFLLLGALARTWERAHRSVAGKRLRGSVGAGPLWAAGLSSPFTFLLGLLEIVLQALFPLILGVLVGIAIDASWTLLQGGAPPDGVAFAAAMAVTLLITWVGIGSRTTRSGAHRMLDAAAPDAVWTAVVLVLLLLLVGAVVFTLLARQGMVDYFPFPSGPRLEDIALWRR
ncbi:serine/threonine-protein kinase [Brachybacterium fresconis]|uniref:Serine/threonine protein kinase n=1 Tax=Brachybacterium fresconis TaxID=173363 RepID=A0ABS4YP48_9MICO|nr:serine/threonine-protein kinase [Brachybacterium fresconis]MBP2410519.1 serine/threonine protein kinase [Brachybacterium fresconis]